MLVKQLFKQEKTMLPILLHSTLTQDSTLGVVKRTAATKTLRVDMDLLHVINKTALCSRRRRRRNGIARKLSFQCQALDSIHHLISMNVKCVWSVFKWLTKIKRNKIKRANLI